MDLECNDKLPPNEIFYFVLFGSLGIFILLFNYLNNKLDTIYSINKKIIFNGKNNFNIFIKTYENKELITSENKNYILSNYLENYNKFDIKKIRDAYLRMLIDIKKSSVYVFEYHCEDLIHNIMQKLSKPRDYFEMYMFFILQDISFSLEIVSSIDPKFNLDNFELLRVLQSGSNVLFNKRGNEVEFDWEMKFDGIGKIVKNKFFTVELYNREPLDHNIIKINYDVKILSNPYNISEKYIKYGVQLI